ncbi:MAG: acyl-CoA dehydrogenase family protein [Chloroflexota bacterium]|nr:acyl-CoA dehydrogenase family protein [Chloroflexota bacterium]
MDFRFTAEEEAFRREVQEYLQRELPHRDTGGALWKGETGEQWQFARSFTKKLGEKGWTAISWPKEYGGLGLTGMESIIFNEEAAYHRAPRVDTMGTGIVGPTILVHGTEEQKNRFLLPTACADIVWCQGFSEPNAGSDSAGIQTRAVEDGDDYIISGQKIFTTLAHNADWCYMTTRTDPDVPKHKGLSYFLVDMKSPGITVRPLINMLGAHSFNEVYFDSVRVPKDNMLGERNQGWMIMVTTLNYERGTLASMAGMARRTVDDLVAYVKELKHNGHRVALEPGVRHRLADMAIGVRLARLLVYRVIWMQKKGLIPSYEASIAKLYTDEVNFHIASLAMEILGLHGQLAEGSKWAPMKGSMEAAYLSHLGSLFAGGTPEIQRSVIATVGLGLPRR